MKEKTKLAHILYIIGVIILVIGSIDPLEGSVLIVPGSALLAYSTYLLQDRHRKIFFISSIMIFVGVCFLFYLSSLGGFGGKSTLSWWWGTLILPYPIGWVTTLILLIIQGVNKIKSASVKE